MTDFFKYIKIITFIIIFALLVHYGYLSFGTFSLIGSLLYAFIVVPILYLYDAAATIFEGLIQIPTYIYQLFVQFYNGFMIVFGFIFSFINYFSILILHPDDELI